MAVVPIMKDGQRVHMRTASYYRHACNGKFAVLRNSAGFFSTRWTQSDPYRRHSHTAYGLAHVREREQSRMMLDYIEHATERASTTQCYYLVLNAKNKHLYRIDDGAGTWQYYNIFTGTLQDCDYRGIPYER